MALVVYSIRYQACRYDCWIFWQQIWHVNDVICNCVPPFRHTVVFYFRQIDRSIDWLINNVTCVWLSLNVLIKFNSSSFPSHWRSYTAWVKIRVDNFKSSRKQVCFYFRWENIRNSFECVHDESRAFAYTFTVEMRNCNVTIALLHNQSINRSINQLKTVKNTPYVGIKSYS